MTTVGRVVSVKDNLAEILITRKSACGENCANCAAACKQKTMVTKAKNSVCAKVGDTVEVFLETSVSLKLLTLLFILPVIIFTASYVFSFVFFKSASSSAVFSAIITACFFIILKKFDKRLAPLPEVTSILTEHGKGDNNGT